MLIAGRRVSFRIHGSGWLLIAVLMGFGYRDLGLEKGILGGLLVTLCLLIHELAHVLAAWYFAVPVHGVGIRFRGAYTFRRYAACRMHDLVIAAAGPIANLLLMLASFYVPRIGVWLAEWNCGIALMNILPLPGTDGYRILKMLFRPDSSVYAQKIAELGAEKVLDPA